MKKRAIYTAIALLFSSPVLAHHSFARFDGDTSLTLSGTVREFQFTNPHSWIRLTVPGEKNANIEWDVEGGSVNNMARTGWKKKSLVPGDKVKLVVHPARDGSTEASLVDLAEINGNAVHMGDGRLPSTPAN